MIDLDTPFRAQARRLRSPTSVNFDRDVWRASYQDAAIKTEADQNLFRTTMWIATQSEGLRRDFVVDDLKELGSRLAVTVAIAIVNREFITVVKLSERTRAQAYAQGAVALDYLAAQPIPASDAVAENVTPDSAIETVVDAAESWLFDAYREPLHVRHAPPI